METKLFVGGLAYATTEESLKAAFEQAGAVQSVNIIRDKMTGRSRGFGFVVMMSADDVQSAIAMWNEKEFEGRRLIVNEARPMKTNRSR